MQLPMATTTRYTRQCKVCNFWSELLVLAESDLGAFQPLQFAAVCAPPLLLQALSVFAPVAIMNLQPLRIRILLCAWTVIREAGIHEEDEMTRRDEMRTREVRVVEERENRVNSDCAFHREQMGEQMNKWSHFFTVTKKILYIVTRDYHKRVLFYFAHSIWIRKFRASSSFCLFSSSSSRRFASGSYKEFEACVRRLHCLKKKLHGLHLYHLYHLLSHFPSWLASDTSPPLGMSSQKVLPRRMQGDPLVNSSPPRRYHQKHLRPGHEETSKCQVSQISFKDEFLLVAFHFCMFFF